MSDAYIFSEADSTYTFSRVITISGISKDVPIRASYVSEHDNVTYYYPKSKENIRDRRDNVHSKPRGSSIESKVVP